MNAVNPRQQTATPQIAPASVSKLQAVKALEQIAATLRDRCGQPITLQQAQQPKTAASRTGRVVRQHSLTGGYGIHRNLRLTKPSLAANDAVAQLQKQPSIKKARSQGRIESPSSKLLSFPFVHVIKPLFFQHVGFSVLPRHQTTKGLRLHRSDSEPQPGIYQRSPVSSNLKQQQLVLAVLRYFTRKTNQSSRCRNSPSVYGSTAILL
jgi:hypothetical protein